MKTRSPHSIITSRSLPLAAFAGCVCMAASLHAQTSFQFTGIASPLWDDSTTIGNITTQPNWIPQTVPPSPPNATDADVSIPGGLSVNVNGNFLVARIALGLGASVTIDGTQLQLQAGAFAGSGAINSAGAISLRNNGDLGLRTDATLTGGGTVTLSGSQAAGYGLIGSGFAGFAGRLTNVNNTIQGAGLIGQTFNGAGRIALTNQGLVDANVAYDSAAGNALGIIFDTIDGTDGSGNFGINSGTLRASNGGRLALNGTITNTGGTVQALNNSSVEFTNGSSVTGGSFATTGTGVVRVLPGTLNVTGIANTGHIDLPNSVLQIFGTIVNSGSITISAAGGTSILLAGMGGAMLTGGGTVTFIGQADNRIAGGGLVNQDNTISGVGLIYSGIGAGNDFVNRGVVDANVPYVVAANNALVLEQRTTNHGTLRASNGGLLRFDPFFDGTYDNSGGTIEALTGSTVRFNGNGGTVTGGTLRTVGSGVIEGYNVTLQNLTNAGTYVNKSGSGLGLIGAIQNTGTLSMETNTQLLVGGTGVTLTGNGTVILRSTNLLSNGGPTLTNLDNTIEGTGSIANFDLINRALVNANVPFDAQLGNALTLFSGAGGVNSGTIQASNGGHLTLRGTALDNTGGTIQALNGSVLELGSAVTITGGTITTSGTGVVQLNSFFPVTLINLTAAGNLQVNGFPSQLSGTIQNTGTIVVGPTAGSAFELLGTGATLTGSGSLTLANNSAIRGRIAQTFTNQSTIRGGGFIGSVDGNPVAVTNSGLIDANDPTFLLDLITANVVNTSTGLLRATGIPGLRLEQGQVTNNGVFEVTNGSQLVIVSNEVLTNFDAATHTLTGGIYRVTAAGSASTLDLQARTIFKNSATITLSGANSAFAALDPLVNNAGLFEIRDGRNFDTVGALANSGTITVGNASTLTLHGNLDGETGALNIGNGGTVVLGNALPPAPFAPVPEPGIGALLASALLLAATSHRRKVPAALSPQIPSASGQAPPAL